MCIITAEEIEAEKQFWLNVSKTSIFASHTKPGYQSIVYSLSIQSDRSAAMILPLPVQKGSGEEALRFIDMSSYADFFDDLSRICQPEFQMATFALCEDLEVAPASILAVHEVGDYEASYVPTMADFDRLDPRFRLSEDVWKKMPDYSDYGFAVFQLKLTLNKENDVHPMAFEFPTRDSDKLFYPTVHVHDGDYHNEAGFYHTFYCQRQNARAEFKYQRDLLENQPVTPASDYDPNDLSKLGGYEWFLTSGDIARHLLPMEKTENLINPDSKIYGMTLFGQYPNRDIWLGDYL